MPLKTSKSRPVRTSLWKSAPDCAEPELQKIARELAPLLQVGDRVLLDGELGVGKTTFARALLEGLGVVQPPEGSPSFAIAHEYDSPKGAVVHVDLYRIKNEAEIQEPGIQAYYCEGDTIVISEWTSMFAEFEISLLEHSRGGKIWLV